MAVTIRDVARASGFAVATVSGVLNGGGPVKDETRRRVREVAASLRFSPNVAARSLSTSRTHTLGVLLPDLHGEFFSEVIRGVDQAAQAHGYHVLVSCSHNAPAEISAALATMRGRVDGVAIMSPVIDARTLAAELPPSLPLVLLNCAGGQEDVDALDIDNHGGARAMTRHLLALGRRRIACIRGQRPKATPRRASVVIVTRCARRGSRRAGSGRSTATSARVRGLPPSTAFSRRRRVP